MKIVLVTPLYPPDTAEPAPYIKELAGHLSTQHDVTIVTYGHLPEEVSGVRIIAVSKRQPRLLRLIRYTHALFKAVRTVDIIYTQNGASVELPVGIVSRLTGVPVIARIGDAFAHERAERVAILGSIERFMLDRACEVVTHDPVKRPEILPFASRPDAALRAYAASWEEHLEVLEDTFAHV